MSLIRSGFSLQTFLIHALQVFVMHRCSTAAQINSMQHNVAAHFNKPNAYFNFRGGLFSILCKA